MSKFDIVVFVVSALLAYGGFTGVLTVLIMMCMNTSAHPIIYAGIALIGAFGFYVITNDLHLKEFIRKS